MSDDLHLDSVLSEPLLDSISFYLLFVSVLEFVELPKEIQR